MLIKWIVCRVPAASREAFARGQAAWGKIAAAEGLVGQVGGFCAQDPEEACVLALWTSRGAYDRFMAHVHDAVTYRNEQARAYERIEVTLGASLLRMPGACPSLAEALRRAAALRVADCRIRPAAREHFVDMQLTTWAPGMAAADGMLGGAFSVAEDDPRRFLVTTLWAGEEAHAAYARDVLPGLRATASVDDDLERIVGRLVRLEPTWRVVGAASA